MSIYSKIVSTVLPISSIYTAVEGTIKPINQVYVFVNNERHLIFPESKLIYEKKSAGSYSFTIPDQYNIIKIVLAGACGGRNWQSDGNGIYAQEAAGRGAVIERIVEHINNRTVSGIIGARPTMSYGSEQVGGAGYHNGENANTKSVTVKFISAGGGGGSSSASIDGVTFEACGGGGRSSGVALASQLWGAKGGGEYGGPRQNGSWVNGNDAVDPDAVGYNMGNGYIRIYGLAG